MPKLPLLAEQVRTAAYLTEHNSNATPREKELAALLRRCLAALEKPPTTDATLMGAIADVLESIAPTMLHLQGREYRTVDHARFARGIRTLKEIVPIEHVEARSAPTDIDGPNQII